METLFKIFIGLVALVLVIVLVGLIYSAIYNITAVEVETYTVGCEVTHVAYAERAVSRAPKPLPNLRWVFVTMTLLVPSPSAKAILLYMLRVISLRSRSLSGSTATGLLPTPIACLVCIRNNHGGGNTPIAINYFQFSFENLLDILK